MQIKIYLNYEHLNYYKFVYNFIFYALKALRTVPITVITLLNN